ncbi:MAG TPA: transcription termination factor NusA [Deinococcales bacterium]|nr:transcription termination factor NusA [Deinococcales bacterium]
MDPTSFVEALNDLAVARGIDKLQLIQNFEEALQQAYTRAVEPNKRVEVHLNPDTGELEVLIIKEVVEVVTDADKQISKADAWELDDTVEVGMEMEFPVPSENFSRIAIQTTKQVVTQKMREAERNIVFNEYKDREGEVITAQVARQDNKGNVFVELGRGEAIMPPKEQIPGERLSSGARTKVYLAKVEQTSRGPSILASRAAPELLSYLMRQEIPEVADGTVEIKSIAREAGQRSKVAVYSRNNNVDPIGACIGHRGNRIQAVTGEIGRERVDIIQWDANSREFIRNALSPAKVGSIEVDNDRKEAIVTVTPDQLSLAIGKGGQNVRLAAKLTGMKIDLKEAAVSDLDAAMRDAAREPAGEKTSSRSAAERFDALFSASPSGETSDQRDESAPKR